MALNILIVDDSETVRDVIEKALVMAQVPIGQLHKASNGQEALDILAENWIDLLFSDINMPVMTGIEMIERMRQDDLLKSVPVVVISTEGSATRVEQLKAMGVSAYIRKPFTPEGIRTVVEELVGSIEHGNES